MAFTVGAAVHGLAAVAERRKIARISSRPAAGAFREVDDGEAPVDRLLIGEIGSDRYSALDRFGGGDVGYCSINSRHRLLSLEFVESTRPQTRGAMPLKWPQNADFVWDAGGRACRRTPIFCFFRPFNLACCARALGGQGVLDPRPSSGIEPLQGNGFHRHCARSAIMANGPAPPKATPSSRRRSVSAAKTTSPVGVTIAPFRQIPSEATPSFQLVTARAQCH